jgi:hypothetical protein
MHEASSWLRSEDLPRTSEEKHSVIIIVGEKSTISMINYSEGSGAASDTSDVRGLERYASAKTSILPRKLMSMPLEIVLSGLEEQVLEVGKPICKCFETIEGSQVGRELVENFDGFSVSQSILDECRPSLVFEVFGMETGDSRDHFVLQLLLDRCQEGIGRIGPCENRWCSTQHICDTID